MPGNGLHLLANNCPVIANELVIMGKQLHLNCSQVLAEYKREALKLIRINQPVIRELICKYSDL